MPRLMVFLFAAAIILFLLAASLSDHSLATRLGICGIITVVSGWLIYATFPAEYMLYRLDRRIADIEELIVRRRSETE